MRGRAQVAKLLPALVWAFALFFLTPGLDLYAAPQNRTQTSADARQSKSLQLNERGAAAVNAKDFSGAEQLFRQALAVDPYNLTAVFNLAGMYLSNQKEESAKQLLEDYTKRYPKDAGLYARLGDTYFTLKKLQEAARAYETVLKLNPSYPKVPVRLGTVYALQNRSEDAERMFLKASQNDPKDPEILANLSGIQLGNGKIDESIISARRAIQLKPSPDVYITLGTAYEMTKDLNNALIAFKRAADLGDNRPELKNKIAEIEGAVAKQ